MKKLSVLALIVLTCTLVSVLVGCSLLDPEAKSFSAAGMTITLTDEFTEEELITQTAYYVSQKAVVMALKEDGSTISEYSVADYAELVCTVNEMDVEVIEKDGYAEFTYEEEVSGKTYHYYARCFKNGTDFWLFQFACETKNTEKFADLFETWASSVTFEN